VDGITSGYPNQLLIVAHARVCVCDGRHSCCVMKKVKGPAQAKLGRATLRSQMNASAGPAPAPAAPSRFREFQIYKRPVTGLE